MENSTFKQWIEGAKVIFVGPSPILKERNLGKFIDKYDIVVRTNGATRFPLEVQKDYGKRTDVLYVNTQFTQDNHPFNIREMQKAKLKWLCFKNNKYNRMEYYQPYFQTRHINHVIHQLHKLPISGLLYGNAVIADILAQNPKELFLTGIDCYINKPIEYEDTGFSEYIEGYFTDKHKKLYNKRNKGITDNHCKYENTRYLWDLLQAGKIQTHNYIKDIMSEILSNPKKYKLSEYRR